MTRPHVPVRMIAAVAINVLLIAAYLWSRGGQTTVVRVEARGDTFTAYLDGRIAMQATMPGLSAGGVSLITFDSSGTPSLPRPAGVDRLLVQDLNSGDILLDERFDDPQLPGWTPSNGIANVDGGLLRTNGPTVGLDNFTVSARDVAVTVAFHNVAAAVVGVRTHPRGASVFYRFDAFRDSRQSFSARGGDQPQVIEGPPVELAHRQYIKSMVAILLRPYPFVLGLALALLSVACFASLVPRRSLAFGRTPGSSLAPYLEPTVLIALCMFVFAVTLAFIRNFQADIPHWPDSTAYLFQAKIFASGRLAAPAPPVVESFDFFYPPLTVVDGGLWSAIFPPGNAFVLAIGQLLDAPWIMPPLLAVGTILLLYAVARHMYGNGTALLASCLLAASPFFLMQSSNYMSHGTAAFFMLAALRGIQISARRPILSGALAGLAFGALFLTRPFIAFLLTAPFACAFVASSLTPLRDQANIKRLAAFAMAAGLLLAVFLVFNFATTGDSFSSNYQSSNASRLGFGGAHSLARGLQNEQTHLAYLLLVLNAWPASVGLAFVLLPLVFASNNRWDWLNAACALVIVSGAILFIEHGTMQGPRMWFEATPFLLLLTARGAILAGEVTSAGAARLMNRIRRHHTKDQNANSSSRWMAIAAACTMLVAFTAYYSAYGFVFGERTAWNVEHVPASPAELRGFNGVDDRMIRLLDQARLENALVLVEPCPHWHCYGSVFWLNTPTLDDDIVFAKNLPDHNAALFAAFPDRRVFLANYESSTLVPFGTAPGSTPPGPPDQLRAPIARTLIAPANP